MTKPKECQSITTLKHDVESLCTVLSLRETEESWDAIARNILSLTALFSDHAHDFQAEILSTMRSFSRPLTNAMNSERTRLSGAAIDLLSVVASELGREFEPLLPVFFPALLTLCTRTNKVVVTRARSCIFTIIEATHLPPVLSYFLLNVHDKSISLRLIVAEGTLACMNCFNPPDLEKDMRARDIEAIIRATARDASADIRKVSRLIFEAYKLLLPSRVDNFITPLTPTMRKYLDIIPKNLSTSRSRSPPRSQSSHSTYTSSHPNSHLSTSTSSLGSGPSAAPPYQSHSHTRSVSSSAISASLRSTAMHPRIPTTNIRNEPPTGRGLAMAPPEYIPIRPAQTVRSIVSASRSTSIVGNRQRTISVSASTRRGVFVTSTSSTGAEAPDVRSGYTTQPEVPGRLYHTSVTSISASEGVDHLKPPSSATVAPGPSSDLQVAGEEKVVSKAQRIPCPAVIPTDKKTVLEAGIRPQSRHGNSTPAPITCPNSLVSEKTIQAPVLGIQKPPSTKEKEKAKPVPSVEGVPPSSKLVGTRLQPVAKAPENSRKTGGITKPTISQLLRTKASTEHKTTVPIPKPLWGRPIPRKVNTVTKSVAGKPLAPLRKHATLPSTSNRSTAKGVTASSSKRNSAETPALVPLPPSPLPPEETEDVVKGSSVCSEAGDIVKQVVQPAEDREKSPVDVTGNNSLHPASSSRPTTPQTPEGTEGTTLSHPQTLNPTNPEQIHVTVTDSSPAHKPGRLLDTPRTPSHSEDKNQVAIVHPSPNRTPISALLSSIQRGFLFTPSSPLSPPQSYLTNSHTQGAGNLAIPFPLD